MGELKPAEGGLGLFHPLIQTWFRETFGAPTAIQTAVWPQIAAGEHVLAAAPTGSGKTLAAFLWALDRLLTGAWEPGRVRVLYVSPLRALNTDIRRNLDAPLEALRARFAASGVGAPAIEVATRSGDTPQSARQRMLRRPPEILVTTPESLNILLTSKRGRGLLTGLETVILDEIHALAGSKRGVHLITAVDRLVPLAGDFRRIALSATVEPLPAIAAWVGGLLRETVAGAVRFVPRPVRALRIRGSKRYALSVCCPWLADADPAPGPGAGERARTGHGSDHFWRRLAGALRERILAHDSTLVFANSRRMTERLTHLINEDADTPLAYAHHGSLSRAVRTEVERRLKRGELRAIVATNSLELGIDIGSLDQVLMVQTPPSVSSAVQRVGRAGHGVGESSRGLFCPVHPRDVLDAAVVARGVQAQWIEQLRPVDMPLDVLAQVILSIIAQEPVELDTLFDLLRSSWPYRNLGRRTLDLVLEMLAGRYGDSRVRALRPCLRIDRLRGTVHARPGVARRVYQSGGTIPDRGNYTLRLADTGAKLGELDEEFVWERRVGDHFTLGTQSWQIHAITHSDVLVTPRLGRAALAPFWRAEARDRDFALAERIGRFLARAESQLGDRAFAGELRDAHFLAPEAVVALLGVLREQMAATGCLPHRRRLVVERVTAHGTTGADQQGEAVVLHTLWGGRVNRPFAMALEAAWQERFDTELRTEVDDAGVLLRAPQAVDTATLLGLVSAERLETLLRQRLEGTGFFGAQFRINAQTALLLPRAGMRHRTPLWLSRQRAKKLLAAVAEHEDFPIVIETWRSCLRDAFDLEALARVLGELADGAIVVSEARTTVPSPFAGGLAWVETNRLMYEDDQPEHGGGSKIRPDLLDELVFAPHLRPALPPAVVAAVVAKIARLAPGYAPRPGDDLADWVAERGLIPADAWHELCAAVARDHSLDAEAVAASAAGRLLWLTPPGAELASVATAEGAARLARQLGVTIADLSVTPVAVADPAAAAALDVRLAAAVRAGASAAVAAAVGVEDPVAAPAIGHWLRYQGPVGESRLRQVFGLDTTALRAVLARLERQRTVVRGTFTAGAAAPEVCDTENLERLLRGLRRSLRPETRVRPLSELALFLAAHQGLTSPGEDLEDLESRLQKLIGWRAPAAAWETNILPARLDPYQPAWLDALLHQSELLWLGTGRARLTFAYPGDADLFAPDVAAGDTPARAPEAFAAGGAIEAEDGLPGVCALFPDTEGRYRLSALVARSGRTPAALERALWTWAWRGEVTNDTFLAVRRAAARHFRPPEGQLRAPGRGSLWGSQPPRGLRSAARRRTAAPFPGTWRCLPARVAAADALERELRDKERARLLLERYGMVCRQLLARELPALGWSRVFRALRLMELSGEVLTGRFFGGIDGLQFMSKEAWGMLQDGLPTDAIFALAADDPASLAGVVPAPASGDRLPARRSSTWLVYQGAALVLIARRRGRILELRVPPDHPRLSDHLTALGRMLTRSVAPLASLRVETIGALAASDSPYLPAFQRVFRVVREGGPVRLFKRYRRAPDAGPGSFG